VTSQEDIAVFELKPISPEAIPAALEKAERYRLLNEPSAAESICLDILGVEPGHQGALVTLLLARTDQFGESRGGGLVRAKEVLPLLQDEYTRAYYAGVMHERQAKALLGSARPGTAPMVYEAFRTAMEHYERALTLRAGGNDEAALRWNTCARILNESPHLAPRGEERYQPILDD
jgi:hypothetical protein